MSPGATFERVYRALKAELATGRFRPGDPLEPAFLSSELNSSITPVRDALHRLVGEALVEAPRGDGFRVPLLHEVTLRHLYTWNQWLLTGAAQATPKRGTEPAPEMGHDGAAEGPERSCAELFLVLASRSGNPEHVAAVGRLNARLAPVRRAEERIFLDGEEERDALRVAMASGSGPIRRWLVTYHRKRLRAAPELIDALHKPANIRQT